MHSKFTTAHGFTTATALARTSFSLILQASLLQKKKRVHSIVNLGGVVKTLRIVNLLSRSIFSTAGSFGFWVFGEGVDSARGVAALVVCRRNSSCNSSCDAIARNGRRTIGDRQPRTIPTKDLLLQAVFWGGVVCEFSEPKKKAKYAPPPVLHSRY